VAQAPGEPTISLQVSGSGGTAGQGTVTVTGKVKVTPGWELAIHTLTVRFQKSGTTSTLNAFASVKGSDIEFTLKVNLESGSYQVWGVIDVKDSKGKAKQIASQTQSVTLP
jgi:hypothetical protein